MPSLTRSHPASHVVLTLCLLSGFLPSLAQAKILYISQIGNNSDGLSWVTAFNTFQGAIAAATDSDEIWVSEGVYYPDSFIEVDKRVNIFGGFSGNELPSAFSSRDWWNRETIIDGKRLPYPYEYRTRN
jgi:hypothetical protein